MGNSRFSMAFISVLLPQPFSPSKPYRRPYDNSSVESVISTRPWKTRLVLVILTSLLAAVDDSTPVVTRSDRPCLSIWAVRRLTSSILSAVVAGSSFSMGFPCASSWRGGVSSPLTEAVALADALPALEPALAREATVFLSLPSAAFLAILFSLEAEGILGVRTVVGLVRCLLGVASFQGGKQAWRGRTF